MTKIQPFLMFDGKAGEAIRFYASLFPNSTVDHMQRYGPEGPGKEGTVFQAIFTVAGQSVRCTDSVIKHAFTFTPAFSFFVDCESEDDLRRLHDELVNNGMALMTPDNYGFSRLFAWVQDRYGVSWQLNLP
ncbi:3-demethylubiquinone-9 3-methyltransferase [Candidatus Koribacter versatilis Ellin345]|uniref:3-demethylubiquinone-9 3-methyltransferase n=1 Tax=Koribacter versatilis (strain Ellin345) TaxID=204669 RepID=Q1IIY0_KORVE|nr:VOC family protein [Candidatus Koribacter versatilis]ABF43170.1 3-demethylubiquinone-9 3-methyltransferase [Candidatus Koribacter versatilis Ellin345]